MPNRIKALESFIKEDPNDPFNYYALAMELRYRDKHRATELLHQVNQDFPDYLPSYFQLAGILSDKGLKEEAVAMLNRGIKVAEKQSNKKILAELRQYLSILENE